MSLRKTTFNEIIKDLIGYDPEKLLLENIKRAEKMDRKKKSCLFNIGDKLVILSSHGICYGIIIFCFLIVRIITQL